MFDHFETLHLIKDVINGIYTHLSSLTKIYIGDSLHESHKELYSIPLVHRRLL